MSARQTKTERPPSLAEGALENLRRGAIHFNAGRFFEAHEDWEIRWRTLPMPDRPRVQAAILVCGVFVLLGKGRVEPAGRLASLAIERFAEAATGEEVHRVRAVLEVPDAEDRMIRVLSRIRVGETSPDRLLSEANGLKAVIHGLP